MSEKKKIQVTVVSLDGYELDGKLEDAIARLQGLIKDNPNFFDFKIDVASKSGWYGDSSTEINVIAFRWETDTEFEERIAANKKSAELSKIRARQQKEANEKREKTLYESLKRKFEKEIEETNPKSES